MHDTADCPFGMGSLESIELEERKGRTNDASNDCDNPHAQAGVFSIEFDELSEMDQISLDDTRSARTVNMMEDPGYADLADQEEKGGLPTDTYVALESPGIIPFLFGLVLLVFIGGISFFMYIAFYDDATSRHRRPRLHSL